MAKTRKTKLAGHLSRRSSKRPLDENETTAPSLLDGFAVVSRFRELPDYENPTTEFKAKITAEVAAGTMPQINLVKIF
ncbi:MAG: hypothetical protein JO331_15630 [Verrucomicrobia bacterium]|nr:hypothetical protein [Verrucomicrobiota bacterium]